MPIKTSDIKTISGGTAILNRLPYSHSKLFPLCYFTSDELNSDIIKVHLEIEMMVVTIR